MLILDAPFSVRTDAESLRIPMYHRGPLSLRTGTSITACLIPRIGADGRVSANELVLSPIKFDAWPDLWRVSAEFVDRPGMMYHLLDVLAQLKFNVVAGESSSTDGRAVHSTELLVDARAYDLDGRGDERESKEWGVLAKLEARLISIFINDLAFGSDGPRLRVRRVRGLFRASRHYLRALADQPVAPIIDLATVVRGRVLLPPAISGVLQKTWDDFRVPADSRRVILSSDTKDRMLRAFFPGPLEPLLYARVTHNDVPGALAEITKRLAKQFDILHCLTRALRPGRNQFEVLLTVSPMATPSRRGGKMDKLLEHALGRDGLQHLSLEVTYPKSGGDAESPSLELGAARRPASLPPGKRPIAYAGETTEVKMPLSELVSQRQLQIEAALGVGGGSGAPPQLLQARSAVLTRIGSRLYKEASRAPIFVSYVFADGACFDILRAVLAQKQVAMVTGREPGEQMAFRDVIRDRISRSSGFVGLWTQPLGEPSPWLLWELGVAQAFQKPFKLIVSRDVPPIWWKTVNPETHHFLFDPTDTGERGLRPVAASAVKALIEMIVARRTARYFDE